MILREISDIQRLGNPNEKKERDLQLDLFAQENELTKSRAEEEIERQIEIQQRLNEEIENELKGNMDEIIEGRARELDMVYPDEEVFINNLFDAGWLYISC